jgi:hypothetical protein
VGATEPHLGGVTANGGIWLAEAGGMMGYTQHISLQPLRSTLPTTSAALAGDSASQTEGTNGITARVLQNILWVTDDAGGEQRNYCADPITGQPLVSLPLTNSGLYNLLAVGDNSVYYVTDDTVRVRLERAAINPQCWRRPARPASFTDRGRSAS